MRIIFLSNLHKATKSQKLRDQGPRKAGEGVGRSSSAPFLPYTLPFGIGEHRIRFTKTELRNTDQNHRKQTAYSNTQT